MEREKLLVTSVLFFFICLLISGDGGAEGRRHEEIKKLFVFGDSYADTGNNDRNNSSSWMVPYGISFPGEPDGRWSDGFVLTDHVAKFMKQRMPVAFRSWRNHRAKKLKYGMNFAFGGTGVFDIPDAPYPNMTTQIALFERMLHHNVYTSTDIENSIALVTVSGNDYSSYIAQHPNDYIEGIMAFIPKVVAQLIHNVKSLYSMGVKQVAVAGLQPLGCLPRVTLSNNFTACDTFDNALVQEHNGLLEEAMAKMKNETQKEDYEPLIFLDLYDSFMSIIQHKGLPSGDGGAEGRRHEEIKKLFVFGDSYADTGNNDRNNSSSWMVPYGISFPGEPDGRWSDGFVLTDHVAKFMKQRTPVAFRRWRNHGAKKLKYGMNFAFGGTGVFDIPDAPYPNMTTQIALFERMLHHNVYTSSDIENSIALITVSGNDYSSYIAQHPDDYIEGIMDFIPKVVAQIIHNVKSLYSMGVKQVAVAGLQPLGCLPRVTLSNNFTVCDTLLNALVQEHNGLLEEAMAKMKNETQKEDYEPLIFLNLYDSFMSIIQHEGLASENVTFKNPLKACCMGVNASYNCSSVEKNGTKMYTLCDNPKSTLFWDWVHPTQEGWRVITNLIRGNLTKIRDIRHAY
ncbi:hypothetical protein Nepgr_025011 [Nepenthes gracilis]|uniref:GDSL esterase/lipase n=1 Tax=Nepenthes gracilis TaxID=150966 RepID=A0AAD3T5E4_NEPGR|nr:hypothetical protein Nepgr_025011 [Nepenthes gracilis]